MTICQCGAGWPTGGCRECTEATWKAPETPVMLGAYLHRPGDDVEYVWVEDLCRLCRRVWPERPVTICHICGDPVRPPTWQDLKTPEPPPLSPLGHAIDGLANRCSVDQRLSLAELKVATEGEGLTSAEFATVAELARSVLAGTGIERKLQWEADHPTPKK